MSDMISEICAIYVIYVIYSHMSYCVLLCWIPETFLMRVNVRH